MTQTLEPSLLFSTYIYFSIFYFYALLLSQYLLERENPSNSSARSLDLLSGTFPHWIVIADVASLFIFRSNRFSYFLFGAYVMLLCLVKMCVCGFTSLGWIEFVSFLWRFRLLWGCFSSIWMEWLVFRL